jgi:ABC-2 type transport system permease protein
MVMHVGGASGLIATPSSSGSRAGAGLGPARALARRAFRDARTRTVAFGYLFAIYAYVQPVGYRHAYPTLSDRLGFAHSFAGNDALRLFYGYPYGLLTVEGYCAWRVGGTLSILAAVFGLLAAVRALRTEEDTGRMELVLAGPVGRGTAYLSAMAAVAAGVLILWLAEFAGFLAGGLPTGGSAYLALATTSVVPVFVGVGALASQLAPTRRIALELGGAIVALSLLLRVIGDTSPGAGWLRWATPLGWAEQLRPFTGAQPLVLLLPALASAVLLLVAARIAAGRDVGTGVLPARESAAPRLRLLSSPTAQALRSERASLIVWVAGTGAFAFILGMVSTSISSAGISKSVRAEVAKLGSGSILTPTGYLAFVFIFFVLAVSLFVCAQVGAARQEEAEERLETLLALPVGRRRWLGGRLVLASGASVTISLAAGLLTWAGAASQGVHVSLPRMLEAGANCVPVALLFLGIAALAYAIVPRASAGVAYGLVTVAFLWDLFGALLGVPKWLVELTPFAHVGLVPAQPFRGAAAATMVGIGLLAALAALGAFRRRDLLGA